MDTEKTASAGASQLGPERRWFEHLEKGVFEIQRCSGCAKHVFYPRAICPHCGSRELAWVRPSGHGRVYSSTIIRNRPEDGGDYNLSLIDLAEGARMMGRVVGVDPQAVRIGMEVCARLQRDGDKNVIVWDAPATSSGVAA